MARGRLRSLLPLLVAAFLVAGAGVLGVLQIGWVNAASRAEEERARAALILGATRIRMEVEDEERVLVSLLRLSGGDAKSGNWRAVTTAVAFWYQAARFPQILRDAYIALPPWTEGLVYSREQARFLETPLPVPIQDALGMSSSGVSAAGRQSLSWQDDGSVIVVIPTYPETLRAASPASRSPASAAGAMVGVIDARALYGEVIPTLMDDQLQGFPFRISDAATGETIVASRGTGRRERPEVTMSLDSLFSFDVRLFLGWRDAPTASPPEEQRAAEPPSDDPSLRFWLLRRPEVAFGFEMSAAEPPEGSRIVMEIFYPNKSLESVIGGRRFLAIGVGVGILALLLASAAVMYTLYRRTAALRANEQEFVASMSHELRTPISVLHAMSDNLAEGVVRDPERLPRYARVIREQIRRLSDMVESILFYSGLQANAAKAPNLVEVDPTRLVHEVTQPLSELAAAHGRVLRVSTEALPRTVCSDPTALRLVMENLLTNAIRHAEVGEVRLVVARRVFDILRITVEDEGPGIPQREQARVFEPFARGERSVSGQHPGSGLGLHLVRRVCGMLGGSVTLESPYENLAGIPQRGCRFTVTLRCRERCDSGE